MNYTTKTLQHGACTINIHRPELTPTERAQREQTAKDNLERVMRDYTHRQTTRSK